VTAKTAPRCHFAMSNTRPTYRLTIQPLDDQSDRDGIRRLRLLLKRLLRGYRLKCLAVVEVEGSTEDES